MSIKDFHAALRSPAYTAWFQRLSRDNILKASASDLRKNELGEEFNSFYISKNTVKDVLAKLYELETENVPQEEINAVFKELEASVYRRGKATAKLIQEPYVEGEALYFPRISFDQITSILNKGFQDALKNNEGKKISDYFQKGHVYGIFPKKISIISKSLQSNQTIDPKSKALLLGILDKLETQLADEDLATSNLRTNSFKLYAKYKKKATQYLVELQLTEDNQAAGRSQALVSKALRKFLNPGAVTFTKDGGVKFTEGAGEQKLREVITTVAEDLLGTKGSPSYIDLLAEYIAETIKTGNPREKQYVVPFSKVGESKSAKIDTSGYTKKVKEDRAKAKKLKASIAAIPTTPKFKNLETKRKIGLPRLLALLNSHIQDAVSANMQDPADYDRGSRKLLTYRTGRLAESVKVERLSASRQGMITAFYSYMKNPYATFSTGGRQQNPKTRDPRLLISKSIREIAAKYVAEQMRAVNV